MSDNIFDKIDKQGEAIENISSKLEGISINDSYALAKRTWDYKEYETAQGYYKHISLLAPLDWKAPFYAALCGCMPVKSFAESINSPTRCFRCYNATIDYINNLSIPQDDKTDHIIEASEIMLSVFQLLIDTYSKPDNKKTFDDYYSEYKENLLDELLIFIDKLESYDNDVILQVRINAINAYLTFIKEQCTYIPSKLTRDKIEKYIELSGKSENYNFNKKEYKPKNISPENNLTDKEKMDIKVKSKCYFRYKDKIIADRKFKNNLICGIILFVCSAICFGLLFANDLKVYAAFQIVPFIFGGIFIMKAILQKDKVKIDSLLNFERARYRLTFDKNAVCENIYSPLKTLSFIALYGISFFSIWLIIGIFSSSMNVIPRILLICLSIIIMITFFIVFMNNARNYGEKTKEFDYMGETYQFKGKM